MKHIPYGGIAQLARALGSYPNGRWFKSDFRYHNGPLVKRLRHGPFTAVTWVRFPYGSPEPQESTTNVVLSFFAVPVTPYSESNPLARPPSQKTRSLFCIVSLSHSFVRIGFEPQPRPSLWEARKARLIPVRFRTMFTPSISNILPSVALHSVFFFTFRRLVSSGAHASVREG